MKGEWYEGSKHQYDVLNLKSEFRNKHIAYCLMRGKTYKQIESNAYFDYGHFNYLKTQVSKHLHPDFEGGEDIWL